MILYIGFINSLCWWSCPLVKRCKSSTTDDLAVSRYSLVVDWCEQALWSSLYNVYFSLSRLFGFIAQLIECLLSIQEVHWLDDWSREGTDLTSLYIYTCV